MKMHIEIRAGEGGEDAKLLTRDQARIYIKYAENHNVNVNVVDESLG